MNRPRHQRKHHNSRALSARDATAHPRASSIILAIVMAMLAIVLAAKAFDHLFTTV
ncbi:MAG: hypothetical protein QHC90_18535 [Shinella sp.]|nr:hypothetical protein [Shinella sp.]